MKQVLKKTLLISMVVGAFFFAFALLGCDTDTGPGTNGTGATNGDDGQVFRIGIVQPIEHPALDEVYQGLLAELADQGYIEGENLEIDFQNAQGDSATLSTIADRFVSQDKDLVVSIGTGPTQTMAAKTTDMPILGAAITSFTGADLVDSNEAPGGNVTGTSDMAPVYKQSDLLMDLLPDAQTVGFIYNSSEANSVEQIALIKDELESRGLDTREVVVTNTNEVQQAMASLTREVDVIYTPTDNTIASAMAMVGEISLESGVPVIPGASTMVEEGGLATAGVDYYELGRVTAVMAIELLHGADPATMPVRIMTDESTIVINGEVAEALGIDVPAEMQQYILDPAAQ
ncbi:MAG: ABC transporter substrate-binding protein [Coriobacteriia bacterium]|nr:ABC transporter substrate-binding protein [Coriobacteriia bacterium]MCL2746314.1 ABC transporter substrate-binding protein [Coriobacteriia bacterium]MCL2870145.1 ABC transporter substrate-binding protein [Coriobacteriia bacterium]